MKIVALAGGVGGAKLADGIYRLIPKVELTVIVNTGDDFTHFGLNISPDLDTVCYNLAGMENPETVWGRGSENWETMDLIKKLGGPDWFRNDYEFIVCASGGRLPWSDNTACGHPPKWAPGGEMSHRLSDGTRKNQWGGSSKSTGGERGKDGKLSKATPRPSHEFTTKKAHAKRKQNGRQQGRWAS